MSEYLHKCNCGGDPQILSQWKYKPGTESWYWVICNKCGIATQGFDDRKKAIQKWNDAMGYFQVTENKRCSNGHLIPDGHYFCPTCGVRREDA